MVPDLGPRREADGSLVLLKALAVDGGGQLAPLNQLNASAAAECALDASREVRRALAKVNAGAKARGR